MRAGPARRVALLTCPDASGRIEGDTIHLEATDEFTLGIAVARAEVALRGEGLSGTGARVPLPALTTGEEPAGRSSARIAFR